MAHTPEEVRSHLKVYWTIFGSLIALTIITVGVSYVHLGTARNIAVGIFIAAVKASLVMLFFMHLKGERKGIFWTLYLTFFFFLCLIWIPIFTFNSTVTGAMNIQPAMVASPYEGHGDHAGEHAEDAQGEKGHEDH